MLKVGKVALVAGLLASVAAPVAAQERRPDGREQRGERPRDDRRPDHRRDQHRHHDRENNIGGAIAAALIVGGIAAILGGKARDVVVEEDDTSAVIVPAAETDAEAATGACVAAAEGEGRRTFAVAQVGQVREVAPLDGGYSVSGDVLLRGNWREVGERRGFRCQVDAQAVRTVAIEGLRMLPPAP